MNPKPPANKPDLARRLPVVLTKAGAFVRVKIPLHILAKAWRYIKKRGRNRRG